MKNGIAMISKLSSPVNNLSATDSAGTSVSVNMNVRIDVRPSAMETGMPGEHQRQQQGEQNQGADALRQRNEMGFMRKANGHDQQRNDDQAERAQSRSRFHPRPAQDECYRFIGGIDAIDMAGVMLRSSPVQ